MKLVSLACVLLLAGCASVPRSRAGDPGPTPTALIDFAIAVLEAPGIEPEHRAIMLRWAEVGLRTLQAQPDQWEAVARTDWPAVRSLLGPIEGLEGWVARIDRWVQ